METATSIYGLFVECPKTQEAEYKEYMENILPLFHNANNSVRNGSFHGNFVRPFAHSESDNFFLFVGISHNQMFISCGNIKDNGDLRIKNRCSFLELKKFTCSSIKDICDVIDIMANVNISKMPDINKGKLNDKWQLLLPAFRTQRKEELRLTLKNYNPKQDLHIPIDYLFDEYVDMMLTASQTRHEEGLEDMTREEWAKPYSKLSEDKQRNVVVIGAYLKKAQDSFEALDVINSMDHDMFRHPLLFATIRKAAQRFPDIASIINDKLPESEVADEVESPDLADEDSTEGYDPGDDE